MKPLWKQLFDTVENAAAPVMADATASTGFAEIMRVGVKISRDMNRQSEVLSRRMLHALNLPAAGDIAYLKNQIGSLEAEVRNLRRVLERTGASTVAAPVASKKAPVMKTAAKKTAAKRTTAKRTTAKKSTAKKAAAS